MARLFVAVEVPDEVRTTVTAAVAPLRDAMPRLRWVAAARYHLTLVFIGSVDEALVDDVASAVAAGCADAAPFTLRLDGRIGSFGRRVLWAGLEPSAALAALAAAVSNTVGAVVELPAADRVFRAHLTLARAGREKVSPALLGDISVPPLAWPVRRVVLLRSAAGYDLVRAVALAGGDA